jgi:8-amino-7-oxononanoate synthase
MSDPLDWLDDALADLDRRGLRRHLRTRTGPQRGDRIEIDGRPLVNFGSNDYLGLASDRPVADAVCAALKSNGVGAGASPLVTGRSDLHDRLERELAAFEGCEAALLFPTGYAANVGTITSLVGKGDVVISDALNHASIIDGCRLSGATIAVFAHRDTGQVQDLLLSAGTRRTLIVTEALFSMTGDFAPVPHLAELAARYNAMLLVDEAHATGLFGKHGRGLCEHWGIEEGVHVRVGTLSKALGSMGGFVVAQQRLIDWLANRARPYIFSTAAPAAIAAAAMVAIEIVRSEPERRERLQALAHYTRQQMLAARLSWENSLAQIVPVVLGDPNRTLRASRRLRDEGFFVPAIRPPSVPDGDSMLRISLTSLHCEQQIDGLIAALRDVTK